MGPLDNKFFEALSNRTLPTPLEATDKNDNIVYVGDLVQQTEAAMLRTPNFGRKSLNEIKEVLAQMGLHLGMEVPGWPPENVMSLAEAYAARVGA